MPDLFLLGGKTRLAKSIYRESTRAGWTTRVLSGGAAADRSGLRRDYPDDAIVGDMDAAATSHAFVVVCAFGPVHPAWPEESHLSAFLAEARYLSAVLSTHRGRISVFLISTVVALMPSRDRAHYGAFKNLAEATTAAAVRESSNARLSVFYPGRLVERRGGPGLSGRLATPYASLARSILKACVADSTQSRVVGWDARLWLLRRTLAVLAEALTPGFSGVPLHARDGPRR